MLGLSLRADGVDGAVFAYVECELAGGRVVYVTEGQLRLVHRAVAGEAATRRTYRREHARPLVPGETTTAAFARGARMRLALAGADVDRFAPLVGCGGVTACHLPRGEMRSPPSLAPCPVSVHSRG